MAKPTEHRITADLPLQPARGGEGETVYVKADITYTYLPGTPGCRTLSNGDPGWPPEPAEVEVLSAVLIDERKPGDPVTEAELERPTAAELKLMAENWLADEGYDLACQLAERERHGDWE
jgi:hypothetical protein